MIGTYLIPSPVISVMPATRARGYTFVENWAREGVTPTGWPTIYSIAETGAAGTGTIGTTVNRLELVTDANAGDDQDCRITGLRIDRDYPSFITGMGANVPQIKTDSVDIWLPFETTNAASGEAFIGMKNNVTALTALPTTARHVGVYWDISAGANFMLTSADGTTQTTTDTTIPVDTARHILRMNWTAEDVCQLQLYTAAGAVEGTGKAVAAFNGSSANSYEIHWFIQAEAGGARTLYGYPYTITWT